jgi:hypothetical protein
MRKRLVRKAFDMILGISCSENRDVSLFFSFPSEYGIWSFSLLSHPKAYCRSMKRSGRTMANF